MKIDNDKVVREQLSGGAQSKNDTEGVDFKKILSEVQSKADQGNADDVLSPNEIQKISSTLQNASGVGKIEPKDIPSFSEQGKGYEVEKVEQFLDLLQSYSVALSDPTKSLRELAPLVRSLEEEKREMVALKEQLPEGSVLKDIVNQAVIHTTVEVVKFNRGDYL